MQGGESLLISMCVLLERTGAVCVNYLSRGSAVVTESELGCPGSCPPSPHSGSGTAAPGWIFCMDSVIHAIHGKIPKLVHTDKKKSFYRDSCKGSCCKQDWIEEHC